MMLAFFVAGFLLVTAVSGVEITNPAEDSKSVTVGESFSLTCECDMGDDLVWFKDGMRQEESLRVLINSATVSGKTVSLFTIEDASEADSGRYECKSAEDPFFSTDEVRVTVSAGGDGTGGSVSIVEPASSSFKVMLGRTFTLKCTADMPNSLSWYHDDAEIQDEQNGFLINEAQDVNTNLLTSLLTKEESGLDDTGSYMCANNDQEDSDSIELTVAQEDAGEGADGEAEEEGDDDDEDGQSLGSFFANSASSPHVFNVLLGLGVLVPAALARGRF